jgi:hypothetical protein
VERGKLPTDRVVTMKELRDSGAVGRKLGWGVKLLGRGAERFSTPLHIEASEGGVVAGGGWRRGWVGDGSGLRGSCVVGS